MDPYNPAVLIVQEQLHWCRRSCDGPPALQQQALSVNSSHVRAVLGMAAFHRQQRDRDNYFRYIAVAADDGGAARVPVEPGERLLSAEEVSRGESYLRRTVSAGLEAAAVAELLRRHGDLSQ